MLDVSILQQLKPRSHECSKFPVDVTSLKFKKRRTESLSFRKSVELKQPFSCFNKQIFIQCEVVRPASIFDIAPFHRGVLHTSMGRSFRKESVVSISYSKTAARPGPSNVSRRKNRRKPPGSKLASKSKDLIARMGNLKTELAWRKERRGAPAKGAGFEVSVPNNTASACGSFPPENLANENAEHVFCA